MEGLGSWLAGAGIQSHDLEQEFASGYLFAKLLQVHSLQPDLHAFKNKGKPDAYLNNYARLQPTMCKLGVQLDTRTAQALINKEPGLAAKVLLSMKQQLDGLATNLQASTHASMKLQQYKVSTSPSRGLLEAQQHKSKYATLEASNSKFFEDVMRKNSSSPNKLMEALHLKHFADEGGRQAQAAADATAATAASQAAGRSAFRESLKGKMAAARTDKATKLQRDEAVHAAILRHQDDVERQELRVEQALAELGTHKQQEHRRAAAADAAAGIDAFEMTLKRLGATGAGSLAEASVPAAGESPMATLGRIRSFAPTAAKLADSKDEYLAAIKVRRQEEAAARKEREGRRHRMLAEQQAARVAAEGRVEADCVLEVLVRRSAEEQKLAQHLWQLQQEKAAMEAGRKLREEQYAAVKDREWEDTLRREAELHRTLHAQHAATVQQELAPWRQQQEADAAAAAVEKAGLARDTAWQLVQLAERVVEYREATGGQAVPLADWRAWLSLFLAGDSSLGTPIIQTDPAALQEAPSAQHVINTSELRDYLTGQGVWALLDAGPAPAAVPVTSTTSRPTTPAVQAPPPQPSKALGEVVADLAKLSQQLKTRPAFSAQPPQQQAQLQQEETPAEQSDTTGAEARTGAAHQQPVVTAAEAAAGSNAAPCADVIHSIPLKLAVVGSPYSGKSTTAHALAQAFGLKLLLPHQLVEEAVSAAAAWTQQQQQQPTQVAHAAASEPGSAAGQDAASTAAAQGDSASVPQLVALGLQADAQLQAGQAVPDEVLVQLLLLGMQQAKTHVHVPPEPPQPEAPAKGGKASPAKAAPGAKAEAGAAGGAGGRHSSSSGAAAQGASTATVLTGVAAAIPAGLGAAGAGPALPAALAVGAVGRGFVIDGFPASAAQAVLLEKALTGLDLAAEQQLVQDASVIVPPPAAKLPQLQRPLLSGLDAVIMLECADEAQALQRVLGRRLDPVTGQLYHLDFDPPPANNPGLCERLVHPPGQEEEQGQVSERLSSWASCSRALSAWLARFNSLRRPLDGCMPLAEVLLAAGDVVGGILTAKGAAQAAQAAAEAAKQAQASAEKAHELSAASQLHAEAAARDLLTAKKAEMQVLPLLTGSKNADPAAAELLKAQAAAKCAEQLKACHAASSEATTHAEHARSAAEAAAAAVLSAKKSVGDAVVSAEGQAQANKAAASAQAAAVAAAEAANKAEAAKQLADGYAQDAEKWAAAAEVPTDAAITPPARTAPPATPGPAHAPAAVGSAAPSRPLSSRVSSAAPGGAKAGLSASSQDAAASASSSDGCADHSMGSAGALPAPLAQSLHEEWTVLERAYVEGMGRGFAGLREEHRLAVSQVAANRSWFSALLQQPDQGQALLQDFIIHFNTVELDMRKSDETKGELLLRCEELRDALWALCDAKHEAAEAARLKLAADGSAAEHVALLGTQLTSLVQAELDRFMATAQFLWSYCHGLHGVYNPCPADKALSFVTVLHAGQETAAASKAEQGKANAAGAVAYLSALQQRLPQLAAALKSALAAVASAETNALSMVSDAQQKSAAAAAHAAATATAAAAAAAAAAGQPSTAAAGHRAAGAPGAKNGAGATTTSAGAAAGASSAGAANSKAAVAAAAANSKLAATSEEAAATAAAAAAAAAAMPGQAALAAVHAGLQAALGSELVLLQHRLSLLGRRATALVAEVVALHGAANSQMAEWSHARYVGECGAVAALERVVKAAAAAGKPLAQDLRLEGEFLVVDSTQQLVPPPPEQVQPRPAPPSLPQGVLSVEQLCATAAAMQAAQHPAGCLTMHAAVDLLLGLTSQGVLPAAWREIDATHMASALAGFDPTYSGYLDWRELLLALATASLPAVHTATAAQVAAQALRLAAADGDQDGCLTRQELGGVGWWFAPRQELVEEAEAEPETHVDVLHEVARCRMFAALLWDVFKQPAAAAAAAQPARAASCVGAADNTAPAASHAGSTPATPTAAKAGSRRGTGAGSRPGTAAAAPAAAEAPAPTAPAAAAVANPVAAGANPVAAAAAGEAAHVVPWQALLLYLCPDRDLYTGISKAMSVVAHPRAEAAGVRVDAQGVLRMCYPLLQPQELAPVCRAPLTAQQVAAAVAAAAGAGGSAPAAASGAAGAGVGKGGSGGATGNAGSRKPSCPGFAVAVDTQAAANEASGCIKPSQLMYSAACERVVMLLLHRYQLKDVYVSAL